MPTQWDTALATVAQKVGAYIDNAAKLTVETRCVDVGTDEAPDFTKARAVARTEIAADGDCFTVLPVRKVDDGMEVDQRLLEIHLRNVTSAMEYRQQVLEGMIKAIQSQLK